MIRHKHFGVVCAIGLAVLFATAACGSDSKTTTTATTATTATTVSGATSTSAAATKIGDCEIKPGTNCQGANLRGAHLPGVNLTGANLQGVNLRGADLTGANLTEVNLSGANLTAAVVKNATLVNTNLSNANLTQANFKGAKITNLNDSGARQCETIRNDGTVNNSSCAPASSVTAPPTTKAPATTQGTAPTTTALHPLTLPCAGHPELFEKVFLSQADNFGMDPGVVDNTVTDGQPRCAPGWASQKYKNPSSTPTFEAIFVAQEDGWLMVSITGCQGTLVPTDVEKAIC